MDVQIRRIAPADIEAIISLMREFAAYEGLEAFCEVTAERIHAAMFDDGSFVEGLIATAAGEPAGYALFYPNFASFRGQRGLYLEDIFVREAQRGTGLGEQMLRQIAGLAAERGFERIDFMVLKWNTPAIGFYERLGAVRDDEERHFKFTDDVFRRLAA
jgi:ribosomal protein S18 acetylase RimI-like enzyme